MCYSVLASTGFNLHLLTLVRSSRSRCFNTTFSSRSISSICSLLQGPSQIRVHSLNNVPYQPRNLETRCVLGPYLFQNRPKLNETAQNRLTKRPERPEQLGCLPGSEHYFNSALVLLAAS